MIGDYEFRFLAMWAAGRYLARKSGNVRSEAVQAVLYNMREVGYITVDGTLANGKITVTESGRQALSEWRRLSH